MSSAKATDYLAFQDLIPLLLFLYSLFICRLKEEESLSLTFPEDCGNGKEQWKEGGGPCPFIPRWEWEDQ